MDRDVWFNVVLTSVLYCYCTNSVIMLHRIVASEHDNYVIKCCTIALALHLIWSIHGKDFRTRYNLPDNSFSCTKLPL